MPACWRASSAVSPTTTRQPGRIWMVVGRTPSRRGGLQPFIEVSPWPFAAPAANQQQHRPHWLQPSSIRSRSTDRPRRTTRTPDSPCLSGRDQASPIPLHSKIPAPLTAADARDGTSRLWQLRGCYIEIAGLPAALGMTTLYSMRAYSPLSTRGCVKSPYPGIRPSRIDTKPATAPRTKAGAVACDITCESC